MTGPRSQAAMRVLVTGGTGFVGGAVLRRAANDTSLALRAAVRGAPTGLPEGTESVRVGDLTADTDWIDALRGVDTIVHAAARVHVMHDVAADPLTEFRRVNVEGTLNLARQAAGAGVRRFVFLSSIKVNGERTSSDRPFMADDIPGPIDPYGVSKDEAERALRALASHTGMAVVIIRPVLVYGPGVKGNFRSMIGWLKRGVPLPLGAIRNKRSLVALDNLVDLIIVCLRHPAAANQTFLVSDDEDLSTTELLRRISAALNRPSRLLPLPQRAIEITARLIGKSDIAQRLCGNLQVDIRKTTDMLGWTPPVSMQTALAQTATASADA